MNVEEMKGAIFSPCKKYRYALWRKWDIKKPMVMFIGLNPSSANEINDDPTIKRVVSIAKNLGAGGIYMLNLFAIVSRYPNVLTTCEDPIKDNDKYLQRYGEVCPTVIFAWGAFKQAKDRAKQVIEMFPDAMALHINNDGSPKHPLYCKSEIKLIKFIQP